MVGSSEVVDGITTATGPLGRFLFRKVAVTSNPGRQPHPEPPQWGPPAPEQAPREPVYGHSSSLARPPWEHPPRPLWEQATVPQGEQPVKPWWEQSQGTALGAVVAPMPPGQVLRPQFGPPVPIVATPPRRRSAVPWIVSAAFALLAATVLGILCFLTPGWFITTVLDPVAVGEDVTRTLHDEYKLGAVDAVRCPEGMTAEQGLTFRCTADVAGEEKIVLITVKDEQGTYEVGYPT